MESIVGELTTMNEEPDMETMLSEYAQIGAAIDNYQRLRDDLFDRIIAAVQDMLPEEGTTSFHGDTYGFKVATGMNYTVDREACMTLFDVDTLTDAERASIVWKPQVAKRAFDALDKGSAIYKVVTSKPKKPVLKDIQVVLMPPGSEV